MDRTESQQVLVTRETVHKGEIQPTKPSTNTQLKPTLAEENPAKLEISEEIHVKANSPKTTEPVRDVIQQMKSFSESSEIVEKDGQQTLPDSAESAFPVGREMVEPNTASKEVDVSSVVVTDSKLKTKVSSEFVESMADEQFSVKSVVKGELVPTTSHDVKVNSTPIDDSDSQIVSQPVEEGSVHSQETSSAERPGNLQGMSDKQCSSLHAPTVERLDSGTALTPEIIPKVLSSRDSSSSETKNPGISLREETSVQTQSFKDNKSSNLCIAVSDSSPVDTRRESMDTAENRKGVGAESGSEVALGSDMQPAACPILSSESMVGKKSDSMIECPLGSTPSEVKERKGVTVIEGEFGAQTKSELEKVESQSNVESESRGEAEVVHQPERVKSEKGSEVGGSTLPENKSESLTDSNQMVGSESKCDVKLESKYDVLSDGKNELPIVTQDIQLGLVSEIRVHSKRGRKPGFKRKTKSRKRTAGSSLKPNGRTVSTPMAKAMHDPAGPTAGQPMKLTLAGLPQKRRGRPPGRHKSLNSLNCVQGNDKEDPDFDPRITRPSSNRGPGRPRGSRTRSLVLNLKRIQSVESESEEDGIRKSRRQPKPTYKVTMMQQPSSTTQKTQGNVPVISSVMSLAGNTASTQAGRNKNVTNNVSSVGVGLSSTASVGSQIIIQPPPPKPMRNKALMCKPIVQTKATTCRPHTTTREVQTDESMLNEKTKPILIPVPVPIYVPMPMAMYNAPQPYPIPIPVPIPIPFFIPTTKKSADSILKHIKEIQERMPADPFEAELLMMAEAVATAEKSSSSDESDNEDRSAPEPTFEPTLPPLNTDRAPEVEGGGDMGEDMLSMALRMAEMRSTEDTTLDLEDSITTTPIAHHPPPTHPAPEFSTIDQDNDILSATRGTRSGWRGGKRRRGRGASSTNTRSKRARIEETPQEPEPAPTPAPSITAPILSDTNMVLKYSFGVNAWKHWVVQKNDQLEKVSSTRSGKLKLFKTDILQCTSDELNYSLCLFVKEVRKPNGEEYAPDSIYYLCLGIQQYLFENSRIDNIFTDFYYEKFTECLNGILQRYEVRLNTQGLIVCRIEEEHLWESKQLGAHSPHVLLNTLIYFNTRYFMLRTAEDHVRLSFSHIMKHWKKTNIPGTRTPGRSVYLRYYAPVNAKESPAQKTRKREEVPVYEQGENVENPLRCPVKLYEFYLSKCPESIRNRNDVFYLVPERSCVPDSPVWYSTASLGVEPMSKMLNRVRVVREIQERHLHHQPFCAS